MTRAKELGDDARVPALKGAEYLIQMLFECGLDDLTWQDLEAWADLTGTPLNSWESQAIMAVSRAYMSAIREYSDNETPAPYQSLEFDRNKVADKVRGALRKRR